QSAGGAQDGRRHPDRRRDRVDRQHGFRVGRYGQVTFSPELEARFEKLLKSYPPGRQRSAMVPMLLYAQDEIGSVTPELVQEVAHRVGVLPLQVEEVYTYYS